MKKIRIEAYALPQNTMNYIARKAKTTAINVGLSYAEEEDLKQHLCLCVVRARDNYDAAKRMSLESYLHIGDRREDEELPARPPGPQARVPRADA